MADTSGAFSMGTSFTIDRSGAADAAQSRMDMSLDDLIKSRQKDDKKGPDKKKAPRRTPPKSKQPNAKPSAAQRSIGARKAKVAAASNARRGIPSRNRNQNSKPSKMEIDKEIGRQKDKSAQRPSRSVLNRKAKERKKVAPAKAAASQKKTPGSRPPSKRQVTAAVLAMTEKGFKPPEGMKMVISFEPSSNAASKSGKAIARKTQIQGGRGGRGGSGKDRVDRRGGSRQTGRGRGANNRRR